MTTLQFQERIVNLQKNMFHFALMLTDNKHNAEDLLQETMLKVLDNREKYQDNTNFKAWVLTIMRNIFINNYRKILRNQLVFEESEDFIAVCLLQNCQTNDFEASIAMEEIKFIINNLQDNLKIPFSMYLSGYSYHEIAQKMDIPIGTVKSRISTTRKTIQRIYEES
ncbi:MAG: RNA polymerase sigma factor [Dysgonamonadaceae bacterium]|jgi:RNA polymerase sigma-70 factor (ECF subfamily)|nr:RNA polymerase sigma factor [Dysgonamonadaceae bacterium]